MSEINLDFTVSNNSINFTVEPNDITFTPSDVQLTIATNVQTSIASGLDANISDVHISGGINGYVLQTDGAGNLTWTAQTGGGGGNGTPGGSNTQIQYNDSGSFGGNVGFTFNEVTGVMTAPFLAGNANGVFNIVGANVTGNVANATHAASANTANTVTTNAQPNITSVGTLTGLTVAGTTSIQQAIEKVDIQTSGATGNIDINLLDQSVYYYTANSSNNFTIVVTGNSTTTLNSVMDVGESMTFGLVVTNGAPGYYANLFYIDSYIYSPKYIGGAPTTGTSNGIDVYTFNLIKTNSNVWTVLGSKLGYT
jgi:hypothetical protein